MANPKRHIIGELQQYTNASVGLPIMALLLAANLWGVFWYPLRWLETAGMTGLGATLLIYIGANLHVLYFLRGRFAEFHHHPFAILILALSSGWCNIAFILAMLDGHVVRVLLLFYLSPIWTSLLAVWVLNEKLDRAAIVILIVAIAGAIAMLWQPALGVPWPQDHADWLALSSGFTFAIGNIVVRKLAHISIQVKSTATWAGVVAITLCGMFLTDTGVGQVNMSLMFIALLIGLIGMYLMTVSVQYGVTHMPAHRSAVILLFELVAGAVSAFLLTDEVIRPLEWLGGSLVVLAALGTARRHVNA